MNTSFYVSFTAWGTWAAVGAAIFAVWWQIRSSRKQAGLQLFLQLAAQYESGSMQRKRAKLARTLLDKPNTLELDDSVMVFYEMVGHLGRRGCLDADLVLTAFSVDVCNYWHALRPYITHIRRELSDDTIFWEFEQLHKRLSRHKEWEREAPNSAAASPTADALREFLRWEVQRDDSNFLQQS